MCKLLRKPFYNICALFRDEIKNKNLEEKHALRVQLETQVEQLWTQFQTAMKNYQVNDYAHINRFDIAMEKTMAASECVSRWLRLSLSFIVGVNEY